MIYTDYGKPLDSYIKTIIQYLDVKEIEGQKHVEITLQGNSKVTFTIKSNKKWYQFWR